jgi:hypothetical protein
MLEDPLAREMPHLVTVLFMIFLAGWLFYLNAKSPFNLAVVLLVLDRAGVTLSNALTRAGVGADFWSLAGPFFQVATIPLLAYVVLAFFRPKRDQEYKAGVWVIGLSVVSIWALTLLDPCLGICRRDAQNVYGPLSLLIYWTSIAYVAASAAFLFLGRAFSTAIKRQAAIWLATAFLLFGMPEAAITATKILKDGLDVVLASAEPSIWATLGHYGRFVAFFAAIGLGGLLVRESREAKNPGATPFFIFLLLSTSAGIGIYNGFVTDTPAGPFALFLLGFQRMIPPTLLAFAIVSARIIQPGPSALRATPTIVAVTLAAPFIMAVVFSVAWFNASVATFLVAAGAIVMVAALVKAPRRYASLASFTAAAASVGMLVFSVVNNLGTIISVSGGFAMLGIAGGFYFSPYFGWYRNPFVRLVQEGPDPAPEEIAAMSIDERAERYRRRVSSVSQDGILTDADLEKLDALQARLGLSNDEALHLQREARRRRHEGN